MGKDVNRRFKSGFLIARQAKRDAVILRLRVNIIRSDWTRRPICISGASRGRCDYYRSKTYRLYCPVLRSDMSSFGFCLLVLAVSPWAGEIKMNLSLSAETAAIKFCCHRFYYCPRPAAECNRESMTLYSQRWNIYCFQSASLSSSLHHVSSSCF